MTANLLSASGPRRFAYHPTQLESNSLQVAAPGLAAARGKHIVLRDLTPESPFLPNDCRIRILDFGLDALTVPRIPVRHAGNVEATGAI